MKNKDNQNELKQLIQSLNKDMVNLRKKSMHLLELLVQDTKTNHEFRIGRTTQLISSENYLIENLNQISF